MIVPTSYGPQLHDDGSVTFRLCAAAAPALVLGPGGAAERIVALEPDPHAPAAGPLLANWHVTLPGLAHGTHYAYAIAGDERRFADPASRWQPAGVHAPSVLFRPRAEPAPWHGLPWHEHVFYELHIGTFSPAGTYAGAIAHLDALVDLGVTALELMPIGAFPGARGWGYDGVFWYAPFAPYGTPDDVIALVDAAHARGLAIFLDVVYNHFGPEGNVLPALAPGFFDPDAHTPWGAAIDYSRDAVRAFAIDNARYWVEQFGFDGLRLDAIHEIRDVRRPSVLHELRAELTSVAVRAGRAVHAVVENDANEARFLRDDGFDAQWADDVHHALHVLAADERDGYYADYTDRPQRLLARALAEGFAYQGDPSRHRDGAARGTPSDDLAPVRFVIFMQNHDQIGNRPFGERLAHLATNDACAALAAVTLLAPQPPLLFMGEEWAATTPFGYFCDLEPDLAAAVRAGRTREFAAFTRFADATIPDATAPETFEAYRLRWDERRAAPHAAQLEHYRELLRVRAAEIAPRSGALRRDAWEAAGASPSLRVAWRSASERLTLDAHLGPAAVAPRPPAAGRLLYATPNATVATGAPWSVRWTLEPLP